MSATRAPVARSRAQQGAAERPTHAARAAELGITPVDVMNRLADARREFRRITLETLRELTATDEEYRNEALARLGFRV